VKLLDTHTNIQLLQHIPPTNRQDTQTPLKGDHKPHINVKVVGQHGNIVKIKQRFTKNRQSSVQIKTLHPNPPTENPIPKIHKVLKRKNEISKNNSPGICSTMAITDDKPKNAISAAPNSSHQCKEATDYLTSNPNSNILTLISFPPIHLPHNSNGPRNSKSARIKQSCHCSVIDFWRC